MTRGLFATAFSCIVSTLALGVASHNALAADVFLTPSQVFVEATRQAIGAPLRADIGDQATVRLTEEFVLIPEEPATKLLAVLGHSVASDFRGLLFGEAGLDAAGFIGFASVGFTDAATALAWTPADILFSMNATLDQGNAARVKANQQPLEARRWILPPRYNPEAHQLIFAALIVPKSRPLETDGEVSYHAIAFGREGYVELTVVSSMEKADEVAHMENEFLAGLKFQPGKAYGDALPGDRRAPGGLAAAIGVTSLQKAPIRSRFLRGDRVVPVAGGIVATIGAASLLFYIRRNMRREARRG